MALSDGHETTVVGGLYFTKFKEGHWKSGSPLPSVLLKNKEYLSASAALDTYIHEYEGHPLDVRGEVGQTEAVEDLLLRRPPGMTLEGLTRLGSTDRLPLQWLSSLNRLVDEVYEHQEVHPSRPGHDSAPPGGEPTDHKSILIDCTDPLAKTLGQGPRSKGKMVTYADHNYCDTGQHMAKRKLSFSQKDIILSGTGNKYISGVSDNHINLNDDAFPHELVEFTKEHRLIPIHRDSENLSLEGLSLTTDDLLCASPDGQSLQPKLNLSLPKLASQSTSHQEGTSVSANTENFLLHSPLQWNLNRDALKPPLGNSPQDVGRTQPSTTAFRRQEFVEQLMQEVDQSASSIITGHLEGGALHHPYLSPVLNKTLPRKVYMGLLTPERENLLTSNRLPESILGYMASPVLPLSPRPNVKQMVQRDNFVGLAEDAAGDEEFGDQVRALLTTPAWQSDVGSTMRESSMAGEDILGQDREWERTVTFKPLRYIPEKKRPSVRLEGTKVAGRANIVDSFLKECLDEAGKGQGMTLTGRDQPGSIEALKNILFRVQTMVTFSGDCSESPSSNTLNNNSQ